MASRSGAADAPSSAASTVVPVNVSSGTEPGNDSITRLDEMEVFGPDLGPDPRRPWTQARLPMEPTSIISAQTINNQIAPTADYATIANIAPSVVNIETGGPGLSEAKMTSMRGFQDGQYNEVTTAFGGDVNGATHHTTSC